MKTIQNDVGITLIKYSPDFACICKLEKSPLYGTIDIEYCPNDFLLEFMSFETWLRSLANEQMTIEDITRLTFDNLTAVLGDIPLCVTVHARTTVHAPVSATIERKGK